VLSSGSSVLPATGLLSARRRPRLQSGPVSGARLGLASSILCGVDMPGMDEAGIVEEYLAAQPENVRPLEQVHGERVAADEEVRSGSLRLPTPVAMIRPGRPGT